MGFSLSPQDWKAGAPLGAAVTPDGIRFAVRSGAAERAWVCLFDGERETRLDLQPAGEGVYARFVPGLKDGTRYGFRADGPYAPEKGLWFDRQKLLVDPYAVEIDRPYAYDARLAARRGEGGDTAPLMPKAVARALPAPLPARPLLFEPCGLIYELPVKAFSMRHPGVPEKDRGTLRALKAPAVIDHLKKLGVSAVELMPVAAWIDERHLPPLGLTNAWGYNPVVPMALDPRLCPGGVAELAWTVARLHEAGIGVILDIVLNHTAESDEFGSSRINTRGASETALTISTTCLRAGLKVYTGAIGSGSRTTCCWRGGTQGSEPSGRRNPAGESPGARKSLPRRKRHFSLRQRRWPRPTAAAFQRWMGRT